MTTSIVLLIQRVNLSPNHGKKYMVKNSITISQKWYYDMWYTDAVRSFTNSRTTSTVKHYYFFSRYFTNLNCTRFCIFIFDDLGDSAVSTVGTRCESLGLHSLQDRFVKRAF